MDLRIDDQARIRHRSNLVTTISAVTVRSIALQQFDLVEAKQADLVRQRDDKLLAKEASNSLHSLSQEKIDSDLVLAWIDISLNYVNILKFLSDNHYFDSGKQREILVELYCYNYIVLHYVFPNLKMCHEDLLMVENLSQLSQQFIITPSYKQDLQVLVKICDELIDPRKLKSTPSDYYPTEDDTSSIPTGEVTCITVDEISKLLEDELILIDLREFKEFIRSVTTPGFTLSIVNVDPKLVMRSLNFGQVLDGMRTGNIDSFRKMTGMRTYAYVIYYSGNRQATNLERKFDSLLKAYLLNFSTQVFWLQGGYSSLESMRGKENISNTFDRKLSYSDTFDEYTKQASLTVPAPAPLEMPPIPQGLQQQRQQQQQQRVFNQSPQVPHPSTLIPVGSVGYTGSMGPPIVPLVGLYNYGSTCYVNSMLQCLFTTSYFRNLFMNKDKFMTILRNEKNSLSLSFHQLFVDFFQANGYYVVKPGRFLRQCSNLKPNFNIPYEQQDTSQFLYFLMGRLHDELKIEDTPRNREVFSTRDNETDPFSMYSTRNEYRKWHDSMMKNEGVSPINGLFQIQQETCLKCGRCGYKSFNYDYSSMMHLNLNGKEYHLNDLIMKNLTVEEISERLGNAWNCPACEKMAKKLKFLESRCMDNMEMESDNSNDSESSSGRKRNFLKLNRKENPKNRQSGYLEATRNPESLDGREKEEYSKLKSVLSKPSIAFRSTAFIKLPKVLIIYLAKFDLYQNKLNNINLKFPKTLKFKLYRNGEGVNYQYKLISWIDHLGNSITSGHYTAVISRENRWFYCDDENIRGVNYDSVNEIGDPDAYVLFYGLR
ncbi:hypothetical protein FOA43_001675 [Brettanomyces nanus]|uniref:ubiquitinyl hydrolase 1 n=1 Tax=Eeniella nana TaxID=13502 RepID=A0A875S050_EENNA|nr:uncharacterized protein FOA43_001675 [Brettanomyces nanus]QPG74348.1 hypothetical protein FOA43_001675 [Brettanomyces nanus]